MNAPTEEQSSAEQPVTMRAASKVLARIATSTATSLGLSHEALEAAGERVQRMLDEAELRGELPEESTIPVVLMLASCMLEVIAEDAT